MIDLVISNQAHQILSDKKICLKEEAFMKESVKKMFQINFVSNLTFLKFLY